MSAVVENHHNYFVFRTAETRDLPSDSSLQGQLTFMKHWDRKYGGHYFGKSGLQFWAEPRFSVSNLNKGIAEEYNLALYKGKPSDDLVRVYP